MLLVNSILCLGKGSSAEAEWDRAAAVKKMNNMTVRIVDEDITISPLGHFVSRPRQARLLPVKFGSAMNRGKSVSRI
jgi:hypothetical protein